jgi:hypothetical protein
VERWEPPVSPESSTKPSPRLSMSHIRGQDAVPESIEMAVARIAIAFYFFLPSSGRVPSLWISVLGPVLVVVLVGMGALQNRWGSSLTRTSWLFDGLTLGILTPILIVNAFSATGDGPLSSSERSVYLSTILGATLVVVGLVLLGSRSSGLRAYSWGILLLPAALSGVAVMSAYDDFKTTTIVLALSAAWFVSVPITIIAHAVSEGVAALLPAATYVLFVIAADILTSSGLSFGGRPAPVSVVQPVFLTVVGVALLAPLLPSPQPRARRRTTANRRPPRRKSRQPQPRARYREDDPYELDDLEDFRT